MKNKCLTNTVKGGLQVVLLFIAQNVEQLPMIELQIVVLYNMVNWRKIKLVGKWGGF